MEISEKLEADIEDFFTRRFLAEEKLEKKRVEDKKRRGKERMQRKRKRDNELEFLFKLRKYFDRETYQSTEKKVEDKYEKEKQEILSKEGNVTQSISKGKDTIDLNIFLVGCYYWIKKEKPRVPDSEIFKYICDFLEKKNYRMKDGKNYYDIDAIKTRIRDHYKKRDPAAKERMEKLLDRYLL
jgi:hypothetical protein